MDADFAAGQAHADVFSGEDAVDAVPKTLDTDGGFVADVVMTSPG